MKSDKHSFTNDQILRRNAEELLSKKQEKLDQSFMEKDAVKLLHELQVHQIELEMQNEELQKANETAEAALKKYTMLYDFAPMGYFTLDSDGTICDLNFTAAEILGDKRFSLMNSNFKLFISEESLNAFNSFFERVFSTEFKESCEINLGYDGNPRGTVYMEGIVTGSEKRCLLSVVDISGFRK